jgi:hypothetical protein
LLKTINYIIIKLDILKKIYIKLLKINNFNKYMQNKVKNLGIKLVIKSILITSLSLILIQNVNSVYNYIEITDDKAYFLIYDEIKKNYAEKVKN